VEKDFESNELELELLGLSRCRAFVLAVVRREESILNIQYCIVLLYCVVLIVLFLYALLLFVTFGMDSKSTSN